VRSRAEHQLDLVVQRAFFRGTPAGVMVEVGAAGPEFLSVGALFRDLGWRVIAVEPNPVFAAEHRQAGHEILEYACADRDQDRVPFQLVDSHGTEYAGGPVSYESTSALEIKPAYRQVHELTDVRTITVDVRRLDTLLDGLGLDRLDLVSVDVEGWELEVLAGFSVERYRPRLLIVENLFDDPAYPAALAARGYRLWRRVPPNDVYVRHGSA